MKHALAVILAFALPISAQSRGDDWSRLNELVKGDVLQVEPLEGRRTKGRFVAVTGNELRVDQDGREIVIARSTIKKVRAQRTSSPMAKGLIGLAIGGGAAGGAILFSALTSDGANLMDPPEIGGLVALAAGVGFAIGAATPAYKTIYKAEKP